MWTLHGRVSVCLCLCVSVRVSVCAACPCRSKPLTPTPAKKTIGWRLTAEPMVETATGSARPFFLNNSILRLILANSVSARQRFSRRSTAQQKPQRGTRETYTTANPSLGQHPPHPIPPIPHDHVGSLKHNTPVHITGPTRGGALKLQRAHEPLYTLDVSGGVRLKSVWTDTPSLPFNPTRSRVTGSQRTPRRSRSHCCQPCQRNLDASRPRR